MPQTVLALTPHPDDAEFYAGGTIAKYVLEGAHVWIVIATDGRRGSLVHDPKILASLRAEEAHNAARVLGAEPPILLGHPDWELDQLPPGQLREQFMRLIRQYRPDIVIVEDAYCPYELHPDHRQVAQAAAEALEYAALPLMHPEHLTQGLKPHFVVEKYYYGGAPAAINRVLDITHTIDKKLAALAEHKTQMEFLVEDVHRQALLAGLDLDNLIGTTPIDPTAIIHWAIQAEAAEVGRSIQVPYAEAFRYVRFHPMIENLLAIQSTS